MKYQGMELLQLLSDGQFHSGVDLAHTLNVSRTTISKRVAYWQQQGLDIDVIHGKGYRLQQPIQWLNQQAIWQDIPRNIQTVITEFDVQLQVSSTNDVVAQKLKQRQQSGVVCLAEMQQAGRGRRGRTWVSPPAGTFYGSVGWIYPQGFQVLEGLSLAVGVAVVEALASCGVKGLSLKWPNDILWQGKKLGGILIEMSAEVDGACYVVIGVGVNLALAQSSKLHITQQAVDIKEITGQLVDRKQITVSLVSHIIDLLADYAQHGFGAWRSKWQGYDGLYGQQVQVLGLVEPIDGIAQGIDATGAFLIQTATGLHAISGGEVSIRKTING